MKRHTAWIAGLVATAALGTAGQAGAADGTVAVKVALPKDAPAAVAFAYPLDPTRALVAAQMPKGTVTLRLPAGGWIVATSVPRRNKQPIVTAKFVAVTGGKKTQFGAGAPETPTVSVGSISFPKEKAINPKGYGTQFALNHRATSYMAALAKRAPCAPKPTPVKGATAKDPFWRALQNALRKTAKSGPTKYRAAAGAASSSLAATPPATGTISGEVTFANGSQVQGTFRLTDASGNVMWEKSYPPQSFDSLLRAALADAIKDLCTERRRIQVDISYSMTAQDSNAKAEATAEMAALGKERVGADGKVEYGIYEFDGPHVFTSKLGSIAGLVCSNMTGTLLDVMPPIDRPVTLAIERGGVFQVFAPSSGAGVNYSSPAPCSRSGTVLVGLATTPGVNIDVPGLDQYATKFDSRTLGPLSGSYVATVQVKRLPPAK